MDLRDRKLVKMKSTKSEMELGVVSGTTWKAAAAAFDCSWGEGWALNFYGKYTLMDYRNLYFSAASQLKQKVGIL